MASAPWLAPLPCADGHDAADLPEPINVSGWWYTRRCRRCGRALA